MIRPKRRSAIDKLARQVRAIEEELEALAAFKSERIDPLQRQLDEIMERRRREDAERGA